MPSRRQGLEGCSRRAEPSGLWWLRHLPPKPGHTPSWEPAVSLRSVSNSSQLLRGNCSLIFSRSDFRSFENLGPTFPTFLDDLSLPYPLKCRITYRGSSRNPQRKTQATPHIGKYRFRTLHAPAPGPVSRQAVQGAFVSRRCAAPRSRTHRVRHSSGKRSSPAALQRARLSRKRKSSPELDAAALPRLRRTPASRVS